MPDKDTTKEKPPVDTQPNSTGQNGQGRPVPTELQFEMWLTAMSPWLRMASSLNRAIEMADLESHRNVIYKKYQDEGWFRDRIDRLRANFGEMVNEAMFRLIDRVTAKVKQDISLSRDELKTLEMATKHRTTQPFFADRQETAPAEAKDFGKVVDPPTIEYVMPKENQESKSEDQNNESEQIEQPTVPKAENQV